MARISVAAAGSRNAIAFLDMLAWSELGSALIARSDDGYNVLVGSTPAKPLLFSDYSRHPNVLNRSVRSTAAGRYQLLYRYWQPYCKLLHVDDFEPLTQDRIALQQIRERRAMPAIAAGDIPTAIERCSNIWASLPGNDYDQHQHSLDDLLDAYARAKAAIAASTGVSP